MTPSLSLHTPQRTNGDNKNKEKSAVAATITGTSDFRTGRRTDTHGSNGKMNPHHSLLPLPVIDICPVLEEVLDDSMVVVPGGELQGCRSILRLHRQNSEPTEMRGRKKTSEIETKHVKTKPAEWTQQTRDHGKQQTQRRHKSRIEILVLTTNSISAPCCTSSLTVSSRLLCGT